MRCIYCNTPLAAIDYCAGCGADITIQKRIIRISNLLYNEGLEKALIRDMKGAVTCLQRSLKFNKENTDARNLLGLCYYETGEAVSALCEWVVSKNLQKEDNLADYYIEQLQTNKNRLDTINQTIRKYNQSIEYCREGHEDMAIIQLKKVVSQNPKLVRAYQLLALLYMKRQEYERARKLLRKAARIDTTNTTTLRYLQEIEDVTGKGTSLERRRRKYERETEEREPGTIRYMSGTETIIQPTTFRDSSTIATFINIALGILLGGAIVWFLVVPANRQSVNDAANRQVNDANMKLASESAKLQELQDEIDDYAAKAENANQERDAALAKVDSYEDLLAVASRQISGDIDGASTMIANLDEGDFDGEAKTLYDSLAGAAQSNLFQKYYNAGTTAYVQSDYATAADQLSKAIEADPSRTQDLYDDALLYLGMACYYRGETSRADDAFRELQQYFPAMAQQYGISGYISTGGSASDPNSDVLDLSGLGDAAMGANTNGAEGDPDAIEIYNDGWTDQTTYDDGLYAAWTDPVTGIQYDVNGNPLPGQQ